MTDNEPVSVVGDEEELFQSQEETENPVSGSKVINDMTKVFSRIFRPVSKPDPDSSSTASNKAGPPPDVHNVIVELTSDASSMPLTLAGVHSATTTSKLELGATNTGISTDLVQKVGSVLHALKPTEGEATETINFCTQVVASLQEVTVDHDGGTVLVVNAVRFATLQHIAEQTAVTLAANFTWPMFEELWTLCSTIIFKPTADAYTTLQDQLSNHCNADFWNKQLSVAVAIAARVQTEADAAIISTLKEHVRMVS